MSWNYRVIRRSLPAGSFAYGIHEVYYQAGKPVSWTEDPVAVAAEDRDGLMWQLAAMQRACAQPDMTLIDVQLRDDAPPAIDED